MICASLSTLNYMAPRLPLKLGQPRVRRRACVTPHPPDGPTIAVGPTPKSSPKDGGRMRIYQHGFPTKPELKALVASVAPVAWGRTRATARAASVEPDDSIYH